MKLPILVVFESATEVCTLPKCLQQYETYVVHLGQRTLSGNFDIHCALDYVVEIKKSEYNKIILVGPVVANAFNLLGNGLTKPLDIFEDGYRSILLMPDRHCDTWWNNNEDKAVERLKEFLV